MAVLAASRDNLRQPIWIHADLFPGPNAPDGVTLVDPDVFKVNAFMMILLELSFLIENFLLVRYNWFLLLLFLCYVCSRCTGSLCPCQREYRALRQSYLFVIRLPSARRFPTRQSPLGGHQLLTVRATLRIQKKGYGTHWTLLISSCYPSPSPRTQEWRGMPGISSRPPWSSPGGSLSLWSLPEQTVTPWTQVISITFVKIRNWGKSSTKCLTN